MLNLQKLETVEIPLNKLSLWDANVRTSGAEEGIDELIASIRSAQVNVVISRFRKWPKKAT
jgi:hypothetical protein